MSKHNRVISFCIPLRNKAIETKAKGVLHIVESISYFRNATNCVRFNRRLTMLKLKKCSLAKMNMIR